MSEVIQRLQRWYLLNCNDDWEHTYGIKIENVDNPGWMLTVDLEGTKLEQATFAEVKTQREDEHDWLYCRKENLKILGSCGPKNLEELLVLFLDWAEEH